MDLKTRLGFALAVVGACSLVSLHAQQQLPSPTFSASVEVTTVDVTVVDGRSRPVTDLKPEDFVVHIDGRPRRVLTANWMEMAQPGVPPAVPPPGYSTNSGGGVGRLILIAIDQPNIRFGGAASIQRAVGGFLDRLQPSDRVAAVGIGPGSVSTPFTSDRELVKRAISQMTGFRSTPEGRAYTLSVAEALDIYHGMTAAWEKATSRECAGLDPLQRPTCVSAVHSTATVIAMQTLGDGAQTMANLRALFDGLRAIPGPKTMVLVSEGFVSDAPFALIDELGEKAAISQTSVYALKLDDMAFDAARGQASPDRMSDRLVFAEQLEILTAAARGSMFDVIGAADPIFERIESELTGYYMLGVESAPTDRDGQSHDVDVDITRAGVTVRSRRAFVMNPSEAPRPMRARALEALGAPLVLPSLPIRLATFSLAGPAPSEVQVLIHAEIGQSYSAARPVAVSWMVTDRNGRTVAARTLTPRLAPLMDGVPSSLQFTGSASLPPGEYRLKLAAAEDDLVGTVEHVFRAELPAVPPWRTSDLMVGGPPDARVLLQPTVGHEVKFGVLHGFLEAYGNGVGSLVARYDIAQNETSEALVSARVKGNLVNEERVMFTHVMPVRQLPPGGYVLRVYLMRAADEANPDAPAVATFARTFTVVEAPVLMTTADGTSRPAASRDVFLPVDDRHFARSFRKTDLTDSGILRTFRDRVDGSARSAFDSGVNALRAGNFEQAQASFKSGIKPDTDVTSPMVYLAATYAAFGLDPQAAGAWQTALIEGSDLPQIYVWLADALLRTRDFTGARTILEEAMKKWPADARFAKPLSLLYATFGQGQEAVRLLQRHLEEFPDDAEGLGLAVEWIYHLHTANAFASTRANDLRDVRRYVESYQRARGPQAALVRQWADAIEKMGR